MIYEKLYIVLFYISFFTCEVLGFYCCSVIVFALFFVDNLFVSSPYLNFRVHMFF